MNTSLLLCFVIAASSVSAVSIRLKQNPETICLGQDNFLRIGVEDSCLQYYQCYAGRAYLMQCPTGTWFNENEQICDSSDPPVGCELDGDSKPEPEPEPEPEPDTEETEESEESEEKPETPLPEDLGSTAEDGSGDIEPFTHIHNDNDKVSAMVFEEELFKSVQELFKTFLITLQKENEVEKTNYDKDFEALGDVLRSYRQLKQQEIETPDEESGNPITDLQVEDNSYENINNDNLGIVKFPNAYQVYKQSEVIKTYGQDMDLEDEDLIRLIISELHNQQASEVSRRKRQIEDGEETDVIDNEGEDNSGFDDDNEENQSIDEEETEGETEIEETEVGETDGEENESVDESQEQEPEDISETPEDIVTENPDESSETPEGEFEESKVTPEESADEDKNQHHHHHDNDDAAIQDIFQEPVIVKESKVKGFFKRLFRINA